MLSIILSVVFGLGVGYFATQNTAPVTIQFGEFVLENLPLYLVTIGSLILGLLIAWIFYIARTVSSTLTIYGNDHEMKRSRPTVADLERKVHELETARLRTEAPSTPKFSPASAASYK
jgi:uncharacterized integral membrane protein